jgi:AcrR family transcriptional regulator
MIARIQFALPDALRYKCEQSLASQGPMKKTPTQGRSRQTVDALIEATALTITERGWLGTTTNHVAVRAGVSVGSLYQYFESREDLLDALAEREVRRFIHRLDEAIPRLLDHAEPRAIIRAFLEIGFDECERDEALFAELAQNWHAAGSSAPIEGLETYLLDAMRLFLARLYEMFEPIDVPTVSFMLTNSTMLVITRYFTMKPKGVTRERLIEELTDLYSLYFTSKMRKPAPRPVALSVGIGAVEAQTVNLRQSPS